MTFPLGFRRLAVFAGFAMMALFLFSSCRGNGTLTSNVNTPTGSIAGTPGATATRLNGSASGGLSPIQGGAVALYQVGTPTPLASAATDSNGAFQLSLPHLNPNALYYVAVTGGSAGSGNNSNIQLMALLGTGAGLSNAVAVHELTTSAFMEAMFHFGMLTDANGIVSFSLPNVSSASQIMAENNAVTQYAGMVTFNGQTSSSNSNFTAANQNSLYTMANALARCVQNSGNCSSLFNAAQSPSSQPAANLLEAASNMLSNPNDIAAIDQGGNVWTANDINPGSIFELNSSGSILNTFSVPNSPTGVSIDPSGNVWSVSNFASTTIPSQVVENVSGSQQTITLSGANCSRILNDNLGNAWISCFSPTTLTQISHSGATLTTVNGVSVESGGAIDPSGNLWGTSSSTNAVVEINSTGSIVQRISLSQPVGFPVVDSSGHIWATLTNPNSIVRLNSSGLIEGTLPVSAGGSSFGPVAMAIDPSGNIWLTFSHTSLAVVLHGVAAGPEFFPYSGPQWP